MYHIAVMLPQVQLALDLYPTIAMRQAVVPLYMTLLRISVKGIRWYKQSRVMRVVDSIISPWELSFDEDVTDLHKHFSSINSHASAAARAELRDVHLDTSKSAVSQEEASVQRKLDSAKLANVEHKITVAEDRLEKLTLIVDQRTHELARLASGK